MELSVKKSEFSFPYISFNQMLTYLFKLPSSMGRMKFFIEDAEGPIKLVLQGDKLKKGCSKKMDFTITNVISKNRVGKASIKWTNKRIKDFTLDNSFEIEFFQSMVYKLETFYSKMFNLLLFTGRSFESCHSRSNFFRGLSFVLSY